MQGRVSICVSRMHVGLQGARARREAGLGGEDRLEASALKASERHGGCKAAPCSVDGRQQAGTREQEGREGGAGTCL